MKKYIFLLTIILLTTSFVSKDLNEYGKWLKFYGLKDEDFQKKGVEQILNLSWKSFDEDKKLYDPLFFYSVDLTYFLDLYSYNILLDKNPKGIITWQGGDPESRLQIVKTKKLDASTLLFFGPSGFFETAVWRNEFSFDIMGFIINEKNIYIPTLWKFDLNKMTYQEFESKKISKKRPKSYLIEIRLKTIKER
jgi:hypothetical protein